MLSWKLITEIRYNIAVTYKFSFDQSVPSALTKKNVLNLCLKHFF